MSKAMTASDKLTAFGTGIAEEAVQIKEKVMDTFEEGVNRAKTAARQAQKRGCDITEDLLDDAKRQVKRHPFQSVGATLGVGLAIGLAIGWLAARKR